MKYPMPPAKFLPSTATLYHCQLSLYPQFVAQTSVTQLICRPNVSSPCSCDALQSYMYMYCILWQFCPWPPVILLHLCRNNIIIIRRFYRLANSNFERRAEIFTRSHFLERPIVWTWNMTDLRFYATTFRKRYEVSGLWWKY